MKTRSSQRSEVHRYASFYIAGGCSIIPIRLDGSKAPAVPAWKEFQQRRPTPAELERWFLDADHGIGLVCGAISGGLEVIDFDAGELFEPWFRLVPDIACGLTFVRTPSDGWHVLYRCNEIGGNQKIAMDPSREKRTLIETRGEGGYVVAVGSPSAAHPTGKPYVKDAGLHPWDAWRITPDERRRLWQAARTFNKDMAVVQQAKQQIDRLTRPAAAVTGSDSVIAKFNAANPIADILLRHGWTSRDGEHFTRPGKSFGTSARIVTAQDGTEVVKVFSSSTSLPAHSLNAFELFKRLHHQGDGKAAYRAAAEALR